MGLLAGFLKKQDANKQKLTDEKASLIREALSEVFTDCEYNPKGSIGSDTIRDACLVDDDWNQNTDSYNIKMRFEFDGNDYFSGKYKGVELEFCDAEVTKYWTEIETDDDGNQTEREDYERSFKGMWMICKLKNPIPATVRIREKKDTPLLFKFAGKRARAKSEVETENIAFNEQFQILADDAQSAFMILTPHFQEHILSADSKAHGRTMLCFMGDKVHIAVNNGRNSFEINKSSELKDAAALKQRIQGDIKYLTGILDELLLNKTLFKEG